MHRNKSQLRPSRWEPKSDSPSAKLEILPTIKFETLPAAHPTRRFNLDGCLPSTNLILII